MDLKSHDCDFIILETVVKSSGMNKAVSTPDQLSTVKIEKDTWVLEVPEEVCQREGLANGTLVSLTFKNGAISGLYLRPSKEIDSFLDKVVREEGAYFRKIKQIGD